MARMCREHPFEHFVDGFVAVVDDLLRLHRVPPDSDH
jgi:hypothetical protein